LYILAVLLVVENISSFHNFKKSQEELQIRFNELFNKTTDYVSLLNSNWDIVLANEAFRKRSGFKDADEIQQRFKINSDSC